MVTRSVFISMLNKNTANTLVLKLYASLFSVNGKQIEKAE